jgi:hypothetical protein
LGGGGRGGGGSRQRWRWPRCSRCFGVSDVCRTGARKALALPCCLALRAF